MAGRLELAETGCLGHVGRRKRLLKAAERVHGFAQMQWVGGVLIFSGTKEPVPGVEKVPKPGREAIGLNAIAERVAPRVRELRAGDDDSYSSRLRGRFYSWR